MALTCASTFTRARRRTPAWTWWPPGGRMPGSACFAWANGSSSRGDVCLATCASGSPPMCGRAVGQSEAGGGSSRPPRAVGWRGASGSDKGGEQAFVEIEVPCRDSGAVEAARARVELRAIDDDVGASDPRSPAGQQKRHDVGYLLGSAESAQWKLCPQEGGEGFRLFLLELGPGATGEHDRPRAD